MEWMDGAGRLWTVPEDETLDVLTDDMRIFQKRERAFRFGTDSVLLADFAGAKKGDRAVDLGSGTGVIALLMCDREKSLACDEVEIQGEMAEMAGRSVEINGLHDRVRVHHMDMREAARILGYEKYSLAVCNPPYGREGAGTGSVSQGENMARHEAACGIGEIAQAAAKLLRPGGRLACVFPAQRMFELMLAMHEARLEPKRVRIVQHAPGRAPSRVLVDAVKAGGSQLHWMEPLVLTDGNGKYTAEWNRIYRIEDGE